MRSTGAVVADPVSEAVQAAQALSVAREVYSRAVLNALESGVPVSRLAAALGVSRQAVNQLRLRSRRGSE